jgi:hypothetical protein
MEIAGHFRAIDVESKSRSRMQSCSTSLRVGNSFYLDAMKAFTAGEMAGLTDIEMASYGRWRSLAIFVRLTSNQSRGAGWNPAQPAYELETRSTWMR